MYKYLLISLLSINAFAQLDSNIQQMVTDIDYHQALTAISEWDEVTGKQ